MCFIFRDFPVCIFELYKNHRQQYPYLRESTSDGPRCCWCGEEVKQDDVLFFHCMLLKNINCLNDSVARTQNTVLLIGTAFKVLEKEEKHSVMQRHLRMSISLEETEKEKKGKPQKLTHDRVHQKNFTLTYIFWELCIYHFCFMSIKIRFHKDLAQSYGTAT